MRRLAWFYGLLALSVPTLTACGDDSGGGTEEVDAGFDAGRFCAGRLEFCNEETACCTGACPSTGICPDTCRFNSQCDTGCCAPNPELGGAPTCQPLDACYDGTQDTSCTLFAEAMCKFARGDFAEPFRCENALAFGLSDIANCERDWKRGCCGPSGCDRSSFFSLNEVRACVDDVNDLECPPRDPMIPPAPCSGSCYFSENACTGDCRTCVIDCCEFEDDGTCRDVGPPGMMGDLCLIAWTGGTDPCQAPPVWRPPFSCQGIGTSTD